MKRAKCLVPLLVFGGILVVGMVGLTLDDRDKLPSALLDKPFPAFSAPLLLRPEVVVTREDIIGKPALVNVWATWCPTCKAEHDQLMRIAAASDVVIIGVNYKDIRPKALQWLAEFGDPYDLVLMDLDGAIGVDLGVYGAPETFLIDGEGRVLYKRVGDVNDQIWHEEIAPRLRDLGVEVGMLSS